MNASTAGTSTVEPSGRSTSTSIWPGFSTNPETTPIGPAWRWMLGKWYRWPGLLAALTAYIPLHELTHGTAMRLLCGVRPKYGLKMPYAWCGSTAWFDRRSHIVTALAPVVLWGVGLLAAAVLCPREWFWPLWVVQISNLSGSAGDLYCVHALLRMEGDLLIQDNGVRMRIMKKTSTEVYPE